MQTCYKTPTLGKMSSGVRVITPRHLVSYRGELERINSAGRAHAKRLALFFPRFHCLDVARAHNVRLDAKEKTDYAAVPRTLLMTRAPAA